MSAELHPLGLERLLEWIVRERAATGTVFGLHQDLFRLDCRGRSDALRRRGHLIETPVGVAAGPHTQMSQNILAAWLCGARFLELKTVQVRDDLVIPRPCIDMADEGYNCEWSQELPIAVSGDQYLDAWVAIRCLQQEAGLLAPDEPGFVMDLSVGYDLAGVQSRKVQRFLDRMTASRAEIEARLVRARPFFAGAGSIAAPEAVADSVTLSTMHGCPPEEIARIATFLLAERGLHTTVKLNPTLLGPRTVRGLLNDHLGYAAEVPDAAFAHDLQWDAALDLIRSLEGVAAQAGRSFAVKLTNTLEVRNGRGVLPASEETMYLSGRALHPLAVMLAARLQQHFGGRLDISFAGGADARNVRSLVQCGLAPVTVCSDLLRPGGYQRLHQYLDNLAGASHPDPATALANLRTYAASVADDPAYHAATYPDRTIKTDRALDAFDCIEAPCVVTCPAGQDVPEYMHHAARGEWREALGVVLRDNPFPTITGMVCDHPCVERCTRVNYDQPVRIRDVKRTVAHVAEEPPAPVPAAPTGHAVAVVGAGPAGLAGAYRLALAGVKTTVFEAKDRPGGMIGDAIPAFRITGADIAKDLARLEAAGVEIRTGEVIDRARLGLLSRKHDAVLLGIGAQADRPLDVPGEHLPGVWPALRFLSAALGDGPPVVGRDVVVVGGGNTAMDAARTAVRLVEPGGRVHVVYRRTLAEMPAAREELAAIQDEGVIIRELLAPAQVDARDGRLALVCRPMRLGEPDASGRPRPVPAAGPDEILICDTIVTAVGQQLAGDLLAAGDRPADAATPLAHLANVFVAGDALRGPATLVAAMGDGRRAADTILRSLGLPVATTPPPAQRDRDDATWQDRAARRVDPVLPPLRAATGPGDFDLVIGELTPAEAAAEAARCLDCSVRCDVCVSVCPDRAMIAFTAAPVRWPLVRIVPDGEGHRLEPDGEFVLAQTRQTANLVDLCNECGNCVTFCPTAGAPFADKPRIALSRASFDATPGSLLLEASDGERSIARGDLRLTRTRDGLRYETPAGTVELDPVTFAVRAVFFTAKRRPIELTAAAELAVLLAGLEEYRAIAG